jgi:hypothetical protein
MSKLRHQEWDSGFLNGILDSGGSLKSREINGLEQFQNPIGILDGILGFWKLSRLISRLTLVPESNSTTSPYGRGRPERRPLPRVGILGGLEDTMIRAGGPA